MRHRRLRRAAPLVVAAALLAAPAPPAAAQWEDAAERWARPVPPVHLFGNLYYVGTHDVTAFLLTTPEGHVLLDGGFDVSAPHVARSIEALGFAVEDVEVLLNSHAHFDHAGGLAQLVRESGGTLAAMAADVAALESGTSEFGGFPPVEVGRILADGDVVELGGTRLVAHLTPGHTPGCTTWTTRIAHGDESWDVVFVCSPNALPQHRLVGNADYPTIAADFARTFEVLRALPVDVFLGSHGSFFDLAGKRARIEAGEGPEVFVDPAGYAAFVDARERQFRDELARQRAVAAAAATAPPSEGAAPVPAP